MEKKDVKRARELLLKKKGGRERARKDSRRK